MAANGYAESVTESIIRQLEMGTAPWVKPWKPGERFMPYNPTTGNEYKGMNAVWLLSVMEDKGYRDNRWMTYKQANSVDAQINRGEKGTLIQYWKWSDEILALGEDGQPIKDDDGKAITQKIQLQKPRVWTATVFNAHQISGLPNMERAALPEWERHQEAEAILNDSGAKIFYQPDNRAFYRPAADTITLPERVQFPTVDGFYATALHELGHWTGHHSRLNRDLLHPFGSEAYAKEELRAEIASLMLGEQLGIGHDPGQHVAYIASWIKALKEDPREIFRVAADAEKITKYLRGREMLQEKQEVIQQIQLPVMVSGGDMALRTNPERVYLDVPFSEKDEAKALGAKWDRKEKSWYAPAGVDMERLQRWAKPKEGLQLEHEQSPEMKFAEALQSAGLVLSGMPIMDGELHRVPVEGDGHNQKSGAYVGFLDGHPAGYINNYKTGYEGKWKSQQRRNTISATERARLEAEAAERREARAKERDSLHEKTADAVAALWLTAEATRSHPYLEAKGVQAYGLKVNTLGFLELDGGRTDIEPQKWSASGELLIPIHDIDGKFWGAQSIDDAGRKSFPRGGRLHGGQHLIGEPGEADKLLFAEGYATAATLHEATCLPVVVTFHSGNLPVVAQAYREKYPDKVLVIAGDNDHSKPLEKNVGRQKAQEAALNVGGHVLLPEFEREAPGSDWNDVANIKGLDELKFQLAVALKTIEQKALADKLVLSAQLERDRGFSRPPVSEKEMVQSGGRSLSL